MKRPLAERTRFLVVLLWVAFVLSSVFVASLPFVYGELAVLPRTSSLDSAPFTPALIVGGLVAIALGPAMLVTLVVFLMWLHRATDNLRTFTHYPLRSTPNWAVAWYFVPFASLFMPYRGMVDVWRASHNGDSAGLWLVRAWWAVFLAAVVASVGDSSGPATVAHTLDVFPKEAPGYVLSAVLFGFTLWLVSAVGAAYERNVVEWSTTHPQIPADWYPDPSNRSALRYWDGSKWTDRISEVRRYQDDDTPHEALTEFS